MMLLSNPRVDVGGAEIGCPMVQVPKTQHVDDIVAKMLLMLAPQSCTTTALPLLSTVCKKVGESVAVVDAR